MNDIMIEKEVQRRVEFKMNEFWDAFNNTVNRHKHFLWATMNRKQSLKEQYYIEALKEIKEILSKEINLPTALDGETKKYIWEEKEKLVDKISDRVLKKCTHDYWPAKSFINNCLEDFIYEK